MLRCREPLRPSARRPAPPLVERGPESIVSGSGIDRSMGKVRRQRVADKRVVKSGDEKGEEVASV